jgi:hypothetical protein
MKKSYVRYLIGHIEGEVPPSLPPTPDPLDAAARAQYEVEAARAESAKLKKMLADIQGQLPSEDQRARWAELEKLHEASEEVRRRKEGEFDLWRTQINEKHQRELDAERQLAANARAQAEGQERELNDTLIGLAFSQATEWFGEKGKTVLLPGIAQAYFQNHVTVESIAQPNGKTSRRVVVRDNNGTIIVDPKNGHPLPFEKAIGELIEAHPSRAQMLRGSNRVGSGSSGGSGDENNINLNKLKASDFDRADVRDKVRQQLESGGGLQIGPAFDAYRRNRK